MLHLRQKTLAAALGAACSLAASAQDAPSPAAELARLQAAMAAMQARMQALEAAQKDRPEGMTDDQQRRLDRVAVKADGLEDAIETQGLKGLKISGWIEPVYLYSSGQRRAGFQFLDSGANGEYAIDNGAFGGLMLDFQKDFENGARLHVTLAPDRGGAGIAIDGQSIVHEASVSYPLGDLQTRLLAGQVPDWSGDEALLAPQNKLVTHDLLFDFTLPAGYTGVGMELVRGAWDTKVLLANVNASRRRPNERAPAIALRADYLKGEFSGFGFAGVLGKATNYRAADVNPVTGQAYDTRDTLVHLFEVDGYFIRGDLTLTGQFSIGGQRDAAITADPATGALRASRWWGVSGLAAYKVAPRVELVARADFFDDRAHGGGALGYAFADGRDGLGPDPSGNPEIGASRGALSLGARFLVDANLTIKLECRLDGADKPVFQDAVSGNHRRTNEIFASSVVMSF